MGLVAPWHVGSSWTREQTSAPYIGKWLLNHWTTREAQSRCIFKALFLSSPSSSRRFLQGSPCPVSGRSARISLCSGTWHPPFLAGALLAPPWAAADQAPHPAGR